MRVALEYLQPDYVHLINITFRLLPISPKGMFNILLRCLRRVEFHRVE